MDESDGESLIGANIFLDGKQIGTTTNRSGYYILPNIPKGEYQLVCTYIGYKEFKKKIIINNQKEIDLNIFLIPSVLEAETITITADSVRTATKLYQKNISNINVSPLEIKSMPAIAEADLLRSLQNLPGILPLSDYSSNLYIRGGTSDQNLYLVDGADVYNPEHAFGLFSTFNTDAIKDVNVSKGGFGATYGGRLSSILDISNLDGNRKEFEGTAEISLLSAKTTLQFPLGEIGSLSTSFRRTYFDQTIAKAIEDVPEYFFYDGHIKAYFDINSRNKLSCSYFLSQDHLKYSFNEEVEDSPIIKYDWGNRIGSLRWTHIFTPRFFSNFWITTSSFVSKFGLEEIEERNDLTDVGLKGQFEYALSQEWHANFGFEYKYLNTLYEQDSQGGVVDVQRESQIFSAFGLVDLEISERMLFQGGIRMNRFISDKRFTDWAPRLAVKYRLTETINLKAATGLYYQYLNKIPRPFVADIWTTADKFHNRSNSQHLIFGFQKEVAHNLELEIETYYKTYENLYSLKKHLINLDAESYDERGRPKYTSTNGLFDRGKGFSQGIEILLRKKHGSLSGWLAYSLAKTEYEVGGINQNKPFIPRHDRTSVVNAVMNLDISSALDELKNRPVQDRTSKWVFGLNFIYSSGQPITLTSSTYFMSSIPDQNYDQLFLYPSTINGFRLPDYIRLDLSLTWHKYFISWSMAPYIQIFNIGNRENVWFIQYENEELEDRILQTVDTFNMFPILPTIGIRFKF